MTSMSPRPGGMRAVDCAVLCDVRVHDGTIARLVLPIGITAALWFAVTSAAAIGSTMSTNVSRDVSTIDPGTVGSAVGELASSNRSGSLASRRYARAVLRDRRAASSRFDDRQNGRTRDSGAHRHTGRFSGWGFRSVGLLDRRDPALALRGGTVTIPVGRGLRLRRPFAIEFWLRRDGSIRGTPTLARQAGSWLMWGADTGGNRLAFKERYHGISRVDKVIHGQLGNARHVVFQCSRGGRCAWYVNGRVQEAQRRSHQPDASTEPIQIGGSLGFPFTIDELAFYQHALPLRRIHAHFAAAR